MKQRFSDNTFLVASQRFLAPADGELDVLTIPRGHFLEEVWVEVIEGATTGTAAITVGIKGGAADAIITSVAANVADGVCYSSKTILPGKYCSVGTVITLTPAIGDSSIQGDFIVYARYTNITR